LRKVFTFRTLRKRITFRLSIFLQIPCRFRFILFIGSAIEMTLPTVPNAGDDPGHGLAGPISWDTHRFLRVRSSATGPFALIFSPAMHHVLYLDPYQASLTFSLQAKLQETVPADDLIPLLHNVSTDCHISPPLPQSFPNRETGSDFFIFRVFSVVSGWLDLFKEKNRTMFFVVCFFFSFFFWFFFGFSCFCCARAGFFFGGGGCSLGLEATSFLPCASSCSCASCVV